MRSSSGSFPVVERLPAASSPALGRHHQAGSGSRCHRGLGRRSSTTSPACRSRDAPRSSRERGRGRPDAHPGHAPDDASGPHYEDVVREVHDSPRQTGARRRGWRGSVASGSPSTRGSVSASRSSTTSPCSATWTGSKPIGCPILVGTSRKGFLGKITGRSVADRQSASVASALAAARSGASIVRVHDVAATVDALRVWEAQIGWRDSPATDPLSLDPDHEDSAGGRLERSVRSNAFRYRSIDEILPTPCCRTGRDLGTKS